MHMCMCERKKEREGGREGGGGCVIILKVSQDTGTVSQRLRMRKVLEGEWVEGGGWMGVGHWGKGLEGQDVLKSDWICESQGVSIGQGHTHTHKLV